MYTRCTLVGVTISSTLLRAAHSRTAKLTLGLCTEHCLDYIRQVIMCNSDISPVTDKWHDSAGVFGPDFNTRHTCKNFDNLLEWGLARTAAVRDRQDPGSETAVDEMNVMEGSRLKTHEDNLRKAERHHGHGKK